MAAPGYRWAGLRRTLPLLGLGVSLWALLPPYSGPELATEMRVEIADHVVPALLMIAVSLAALIRRRRAGADGGPGASFMLVAGLVVLLAGFWMVATHVPLVAQARRGEVPAGTAAYHTAPGIAVVLLGLVWAALHWNDTAPETGPKRAVEPGSR